MVFSETVIALKFPTTRILFFPFMEHKVSKIVPTEAVFPLINTVDV